MRVLEGTHLLHAAETLLDLLHLGEDLIAGVFVRSLGLLLGENSELGLELLGLGHLVEEAGKESTLLGGDLGGGSVVGDSTVTDGPDVLGTLNDKVLVDVKTTASVGLCGNLAHEVLDNGTESVTSSPDEKTVGNALQNLLASLLVGVLGLDVLLSDVLNHGLVADLNSLLLESLLGVVDQVLGEHGKDGGKGLDEGDAEVANNLRNPLLEVVLEEILKLASEFDTSGATTDDNHVQQTLDLLGALVLESGSLTAVHDALANLLSVADLLQEAAVFLDTRDTESSVLSADTDDEHVEGDLGLRSSALDLRFIVDVDNLFLVVDLGGLGFVVLDGGGLVTEEVADGFHNAAVFDGTSGARREQRSEEEVVARRDDDDIVVFRVELLEERD